VSADGITPEQAAHVLAHFGCPGGYAAGGFTTDLIAVMCRADPANLAMLCLGFPGYVRAVRLARDTTGGVARLQEIAREVGQ
jgi:hypothetical protein